MHKGQSEEEKVKLRILIRLKMDLAGRKLIMGNENEGWF